MYRIEVSLSADLMHAKQPYYWVLYGFDTSWQNEGAGWAKTPQDAWNEAYAFYVRYKAEKG